MVFIHHRINLIFNFFFISEFSLVKSLTIGAAILFELKHSTEGYDIPATIIQTAIGLTITTTTENYQGRLLKASA
jgi:hypothetical protein